MKIAIAVVGSRRRKDYWNVTKMMDMLVEIYGKFLFVSGGCGGIDLWAEERADYHKLVKDIIRPNLRNVKHRGDMISRYYARNEKVAKKVELVVAFPAKDRKGGTENTLKWAEQFNKDIIIIEEGSEVKHIGKRKTSK